MRERARACTPQPAEPALLAELVEVVKQDARASSGTSNLESALIKAANVAAIEAKRRARLEKPSKDGALWCDTHYKCICWSLCMTFSKILALSFRPRNVGRITDVLAKTR